MTMGYVQHIFCLIAFIIIVDVGCDLYLYLVYSNICENKISIAKKRHIQTRYACITALVKKSVIDRGEIRGVQILRV